MSTLRINNIEAQSVPASPTIDEKVKVTNSSGDILVNIDGKTSGITTIGINTTDGNIKFDANSNVLITGILTATTLAGNFTPDSLEIGSNIKLGNAGVITATSFVGSGAASLSPSGNADELVIGASNGTRGITIFGATSNIFFGDSGDNDIGQIQYEHSDNSMRFNTNDTERLRIASDGTLTYRTGGGKGYDFNSSGSSAGIANMFAPASYTLAFGTNNTERLRITSDGELVIGMTAGGGASEDARLQVRGDTYARAKIQVLGTHNDDNPVGLTLAKSRGSGNTILGDNDDIGQIDFAGNDGNGFHNVGRIMVSSDGSGNGNNDLPSMMRFFTTANGGVSLTERMRLTSAGSVRLLDFSTAVDSGADDFVVGTTNSGINRGMTILSHTGADARICFATASDPDEGMIKYSHGSDMLQFFVDAAERMRIENLGDAEYGMKFLNSKAIEFKDQAINICSLTWSINAATWTNFFSHQSYFQGWVFLNGTHNAGNSSALWSISKSPSGGSTANRFAHDNSYSPASVNMRVNGLWTQINTSYATYGYAVLISLAGGNNVANLSG